MLFLLTPGAMAASWHPGTVETSRAQGPPLKPQSPASLPSSPLSCWAPQGRAPQQAAGLQGVWGQLGSQAGLAREPRAWTGREGCSGVFLIALAAVILICYVARSSFFRAMCGELFKGEMSGCMQFIFKILLHKKYSELKIQMWSGACGNVCGWDLLPL